MLITCVSLVFLFSCSSQTDTIKIKGSDTEVNLAVLLAEAFHKHQPNILVSVSGGGSGLGIASLLNGNATIANSSRSIKENEIYLFNESGVSIDSLIFAQDAIAFIVSDSSSLDSISIHQIAAILSGKITQWSDFVESNLPITIYGRQSNSGTYDYVKSRLHIHFSPYAKQMNGNAQIIEALRSDKSGIGYVSAGYVLKGQLNGIKVLSVYAEDKSAVSPLDAKAIELGLYSFQRPLFQYYRSKDYPKIKAFLDFQQSEIGAQIIQQSGYYPVKKQA
jgi:phosphate transport system substrate-binding protein